MEPSGKLHPEPFCVALLTDGLFPLSIGGMQKHSVRLAASLADAGARILLFHPHEQLDVAALFTPNQRANIEAIYIPWPAAAPVPGHYLLRNYRYSKAIHEVLLREQQRIHAVYVQGFAGWKTISSGLKGIPVVLNLHGMEMFQAMQGWRNKVQGFMLRLPAARLIKKADAVVSLGGKLSQIIARIAPAQSILTLPVGIDDSWFEQPNQASPKEKTVLFVGRYEWRKGLDLLNQVMPKLLQQTQFQASFRFIGDIPEDKRLVHDRVFYEGALRDEQRIRSIYRSAYALVCPSYSEGMPTVILEAMASGLPVVASDVGAVALLVSAENGRLIEPGNAAVLESALEAILKLTEPEAAALGAASKTKAAAFNWKQIGRLTLQALQALKA
jgi:glycosyltransferase involved in cell wall biosynthesis